MHTYIPVSFVNVNGDLVSVSAPKKVSAKKPGLKRVSDPDKASAHFGFEVVGVAKKDVENARDFAKHKKKVFSEDGFINASKPKRAIRRVFNLPESANLAAQILEQAGTHFKVSVLPILKG